MEIIIENREKAELFINIFQNIKLFSDIFTVDISPEVFYIQGMDASHVSIFEIKLTNEWFDVFNIDSNIAIGLNSNIFPKILTTWTCDHNIKLSIVKDDILDVAFEKISGDSEYNKYFEIPLVDIECERLSIPEQEYTIDLEFDSKKLKKLIDELIIIGEQVNISCTENEVNVTTKSLEGSMKINIPFDDIEAYSIEEGEFINIQFTLRYMKNMCLFNKISPTVKIHLTNDVPMQFRYEMENNSYVRFYLAPHLDDSD
jgi:proliferating cell nuclear antigen